MGVEVVQTLYDGSAHYRQTTPLDGVLFVLYFDYNSRDQCWYLSIHDSEDQPIAGCIGRKLVANSLPITRSTAADRPAGQLILVSMDHQNPGLYDLGVGSTLFYIPADDLDSVLEVG